MRSHTVQISKNLQVWQYQIRAEIHKAGCHIPLVQVQLIQSHRKARVSGPMKPKNVISYNQEIPYPSICLEKLLKMGAKFIIWLLGIVTTGKNPNIHQYISLKKKKKLWGLLWWSAFLLASVYVWVFLSFFFSVLLGIACDSWIDGFIFFIHLKNFWKLSIWILSSLHFL